MLLLTVLNKLTVSVVSVAKLLVDGSKYNT